MKPVVTIVMPCFGRPMRTVRMLNCLADQTMKNFELVMIGDNCPDFRDLILSSWFQEWRREFLSKGRHLFYMNLKTRRGGHGAGAVNTAIRVACGKYICWANNDDMLYPEHIEYYHRSIACFNAKEMQVDFVYNNSLVNGESGFEVREPVLKFGSCGHSELIVATDFLRKMPAHQPVYGQDWKLIQDMISAGGRSRKGDVPFPTYMVMSTPRYQEKDID